MGLISRVSSRTYRFFEKFFEKMNDLFNDEDLFGQYNPEAGYQEGYNDGYKDSYNQGYKFGQLKGAELGREFYEILKFCELISSGMNKSDQNTSRNQRISRNITKIKILIENFNSKPSDEDFLSKVEFIRSIFKTIAANGRKVLDIGTKEEGDS